MTYLSIEFAVCFLAFLAVYWLLAFSRPLQKAVLLIASYAFYATLDWRFPLILGIYTLILYALSFKIEGGHKKWAGIAIGASLLNLAVFKYFDFFREGAQNFLNLMGSAWLIPGLEILLPVGISFYTFQSIAYLVSLAKKERLTPSLLDLSLYLSFFPTLLAGPICRPNGLLTQLESLDRRVPLQVNYAFILILLAIAKKLWLAGWLATSWVDPIFANPAGFHAVEVFAAMHAYALQIYCDFSGYTDLVTAIALLLGYTVPQNFNQPYLATNLRDFWRRWHMSLSTWIRDHVYIPLGGNRQGWGRAQINLLIAMILSGLWHGANLKYLVWGALHGGGLVLLNTFDRIWGEKALTRRVPWLAQCLCFESVVLIWVFFRAATLEEAFSVLNALGGTETALTLNVLGFFVFLGALAWLSPKMPWLLAAAERRIERLPMIVLPFVFSALALFWMMLAPSGIPAFIYYQF